MITMKARVRSLEKEHGEEKEERNNIVITYLNLTLNDKTDLKTGVKGFIEINVGGQYKLKK